MRDLRLSREERGQASRARDELEIHIEEVLIEDARLFRDVRRKEVGEHVAVRDHDLGPAGLRRRARWRPSPGTGCEDDNAGKSDRERPCHRTTPPYVARPAETYAAMICK